MTSHAKTFLAWRINNENHNAKRISCTNSGRTPRLRTYAQASMLAMIMLVIDTLKFQMMVARVGALV